MSEMEQIEARLELALREPEREIGDTGFSETVVSALPARRTSRTKARRWTLGGAALAGSIVTSVLGAPLETAFSSFVLGGSYGTLLLVALIAGAVAIPTAWVFYTK
jgi:hypothetical protein